MTWIIIFLAGTSLSLSAWIIWPFVRAMAKEPRRPAVEDIVTMRLKESMQVYGDMPNIPETSHD